MEFKGIVGKGKGLGAVFGFPTANIPFSDADVSGVYAATVSAGGKRYAAAAYADRKRGLLEAHLFDFSGDLYGTEIVIALGAKIREDRAFSDDAELIRQIGEDVAAARALFDTI